MSFKQFILNEQSAYLGQKVGDILAAIHELRDDAKHMGTRDLTRFSERIVNQIRRLLHSNWPREEAKHLKTLQKAAVAIMKSIEEKEDLPGTISGVASVLEKLVADLGTPINKLAGQPESPDKDESGLSTAEKQSIPPKKPVTMDAPVQAAPPQPTQNLYSPPLGGSSGPLDAF